jgi:DNA polymerase
VSRDASVSEQLAARVRELSLSGLDGLPRRPGGWTERRRGPGATGASAVGPRRPARAREAGGGEGAAARDAPDGAGAAVAQPAARVPEGEATGGARDWTTLPLPELRAFLADCRRCRLCEKRTQVVFGVGDPQARLMFVGEGPGRDEDLQGEPFVGKAGRLLTDMIEKGLRLRRSDVYIANVVKCRPPENRDPLPDEVAACEGFLRRQIRLVSPEVIVALGRFAAQTLLRCTTPVSKLRGRWHEYEGTPVLPTFHPAYLLRTPADKRLAWEDLKLVIERLGLPR